MSLPKPMRLPPSPFATQLLAIPGVERVQFKKGQVLLYAGHYPPGIFFIMSGSVAVQDPTQAGEELELDAGDGAFVLPGLGELDLKAGRTVRAASDVELLLAPRSILQADPQLRGIFQNPQLVQVSLQRPAPEGGER